LRSQRLGRLLVEENRPDRKTNRKILQKDEKLQFPGLKEDGVGGEKGREWDSM